MGDIIGKSFQIHQGCWNQGGRGGNCPPTFAKISPKFLQNRGFCLKFLLFAPHFGPCPPLVGKFQQPWIIDFTIVTLLLTTHPPHLRYIIYERPLSCTSFLFSNLNFWVFWGYSRLATSKDWPSWPLWNLKGQISAKQTLDSPKFMILFLVVFAKFCYF